MWKKLNKIKNKKYLNRYWIHDLLLFIKDNKSLTYLFCLINYIDIIFYVLLI